VVTTGPGLSGCELACSLDCPGSGPDCVEECEAQVPPSCFDEYDALIVCLIPFLDPTCTVPSDVCVPEVEAFSDCASAPQPG
jgi:hypothetical protein